MLVNEVTLRESTLKALIVAAGELCAVYDEMEINQEYANELGKVIEEAIDALLVC
jgi:hypothetical protein